MSIRTDAIEHARLSIVLPMTPEWYDDLTQAQRLTTLCLYLMSGNCVHPREYGDHVGVSRYSIYRLLYQLSQMGVPVVRESRGRWMLTDYLPKVNVFDELRREDAN